MSKNTTEMTDSEWEAKFNGPRDRLLKKIFGDVPCPVSDLSPKTVICSSEKKSKNESRVYKSPMMEDTRWLAEWNEQMRTTGKVVKKITPDKLAELGVKTEPVK